MSDAPKEVRVDLSVERMGMGIKELFSLFPDDFVCGDPLRSIVLSAAALPVRVTAARADFEDRTLDFLFLCLCTSAGGMWNKERIPFYVEAAKLRYASCDMGTDSLNPGIVPENSSSEEEDGMFPVDGVLGEYFPEENRITVHMGAVDGFSQLVRLPKGAVALAVAVHEAAHALMRAASPPPQPWNVPEAVEELLADALSGSGLFAVSFFGGSQAWEAWKALDLRRFRLGGWIAGSLSSLWAVGFAASVAIACGAGAPGMIEITSDFLAGRLKRRALR